MPHRFARPLLALVVAAGALVAGPVVKAAGDDTPDIEAARAGLAAYLDANRPDSPQTSTDLPGCPAITLERLQQSLGDAGIDDSVEDWGTEIEWNEYADIDPDLMGITCGGDADGDSHNGDYELAVSVFAVDAGDDERAQEVVDQLGFGALEFGPADVPGGELASACIDDPENGLSLCFSFWSSDGFVLGVGLASDVSDIPDGASSAVLADTFDDIIATLGDVTGTPAPTTEAMPDSVAPATSTADGPLDIAGARAGLSELVDNSPDSGPNEPLAECPVVDRAAVNGALETAGVDAPLADWSVEFGLVDTGPSWNDRGITCTGAYIGSEQDESFPELSASLIVVDLGDSAAFEQFLADAYPGVADPLPTPALGGATRGECADVDLTDQCVEFWEQDGFVVGIVLADRVFMDRPTASAVLNALVPAVVDRLVAVPEAEEPAAFEATPEQMEAARVGVSNVIESAGALMSFQFCPVVDPEVVAAALEESGVKLDRTREQWTALVDANGSIDDAAGVRCSGRMGADAVRIEVYDYVDSASAHDVIDLVHGCESAGSTTFCVESWEQDGLTITITVAAPGVERDAVARVLETLVPLVLHNLAAAS